MTFSCYLCNFPQICMDQRAQDKKQIPRFVPRFYPKLVELEVPRFYPFTCHWDDVVITFRFGGRIRRFFGWLCYQQGVDVDGHHQLQRQQTELGRNVSPDPANPTAATVNAVCPSRRLPNLAPPSRTRHGPPPALQVSWYLTRQ